MADSGTRQPKSRFQKVIICADDEDVYALANAYSANPKDFETDAIYLVKTGRLIRALYFMPHPNNIKKRDNSKVWKGFVSFPKNTAFFPSDIINLWSVPNYNRIEIDNPNDIAAVAELCRANRMHVLPILPKKSNKRNKHELDDETENTPYAAAILDLQKAIDEFFVQNLNQLSVKCFWNRKPPIVTINDFYNNITQAEYEQLRQQCIADLQASLLVPPPVKPTVKSTAETTAEAATECSAASVAETTAESGTEFTSESTSEFTDETTESVTECTAESFESLAESTAEAAGEAAAVLDKFPNVLSKINAMLNVRSYCLRRGELKCGFALLNIKPEVFTTGIWLAQCLQNFKLLTEYGSITNPGLIAANIVNNKVFVITDIQRLLGQFYITEINATRSAAQGIPEFRSTAAEAAAAAAAAAAATATAVAITPMQQGQQAKAAAALKSDQPQQELQSQLQQSVSAISSGRQPANQLKA